MKDSELIALLWERAEQALECLARQFGRRLFLTARNILGSAQDAEESVNDTYLAVWEAIPPKKPDPLAGFVYRIGRNIALDKLKYNMAEKRNGHYDLSLEELENCIPAPALDEQVEARELGRLINAFLGTIDPRSRDLFLRRYWFGDSVREIAADFQMRPNTVSVRLGRIRMQLRTYFMKEGYCDET